MARILILCTAQALAHVGVNYAIVDKGSEAVHEKNGQHSSFGITGVVAADQDCNYTDKESSGCSIVYNNIVSFIIWKFKYIISICIFVL